MSVEILKQVFCDECGGGVVDALFEGESIREIRKRAKEFGWGRSKNKDFCEKCLRLRRNARRGKHG